jgi:hypothetical protein
MVERLHRRLKDALLAHGATTTWAAELPWVLLGLRSTPRDDTNISPAQPLYGTPLVLPNQYLSINNEQTKNEFIIQIDKILNNLPMTRHNTAADKELPEDLPRELWATDRVWARQGDHALPLSTLYDGPYTVLQRSLRLFWLQLGNREDNVSTSRLKPCTGGAAAPTAAPPQCSRPCREPPKHVRFNLTPTPQPVAADPGTIFPGKPARFFARPGEASSSRYPQRNRGPPAWQWNYTFFAASRDQEAGVELCGHPTEELPTPLFTTRDLLMTRSTA